MNRQEFVSCVNCSQRNLRRFLAGLCAGDLSLADDIAQEALLKAYMASEDFNDIPKFNAWITKIAYNTFINYTRNNSRFTSISDVKNQESEFYADSSFKYEKLYKALRLLSLRERSVITLFYLEGYSSKEISDILEISEDSTRQSLSRARKHLKSLIE